MTKPEEVIIDGDSTEEEDEDEVTIITPESRKRRRRSNILLDQDEDEGVEESKIEAVKDSASSSSVAPQRQQQLLLSQNGVSSRRMTLRTPIRPRQANRIVKQLSISAAVASGEHGRRQQEERVEKRGEEDVQIVSTPFLASVSCSGRKGRRPAIDKRGKLIGEQQNGEQPESDHEEVDIAIKETAASRRSSRIEHRRKDKHHEKARKLAPILETCLENLLVLGPHYNGRDDEFKGESDSDENSPPPKRRRQSVQRLGERDYQEREYADGDDDVDDFICGDDEVEYMNDDEEAVISVESSDDEVEEDHPRELTAMLAAGRSREVHEWFDIYMEYLEKCVIDDNFETTMRRKRSKAKYQLYEQAINCIERKLCSCRDTVRSGVAWPDELVDALKHASIFHSRQVSAERNCDACKRQQHLATYHVELAGYAYDATKLYNSNWMRHLKEAVKNAAPVQITFEMGSVCYARTLAYWQLLHAKQFWCILIDAKLKSCADNTGCIADPYREEFFKKEFGRYKRLVDLVEKFSEETKRTTQYMPNTWKRITRRSVTSDFLPLPLYVSSDDYLKSQSGTLDAFVDESVEEGTEDEEEVMEQLEKDNLAGTNGHNDGGQATNDGEVAKVKEMILLNPTPRSERRTSRLESKKQRKSHFADQKKDEPKLSDEMTLPEKDIDDLMCLVCNANPRNAGVLHGLYLHVYCCYACAKRQHGHKSGCMVCNRPIDRVLRLLPLTLDARKAIRNQQTKT